MLRLKNLSTRSCDLEIRAQNCYTVIYEVEFIVTRQAYVFLITMLSRLSRLFFVLLLLLSLFCDGSHRLKLSLGL